MTKNHDMSKNEESGFWEIVGGIGDRPAALDEIAGNTELIEAFIEYHRLGFSNDPSWPAAYEKFKAIYTRLSTPHGLSDDDMPIVSELILDTIFRD